MQTPVGSVPGSPGDPWAQRHTAGDLASSLPLRSPTPRALALGLRPDTCVPAGSLRWLGRSPHGAELLRGSSGCAPRRRQGRRVTVGGNHSSRGVSVPESTCRREATGTSLFVDGSLCCCFLTSVFINCVNHVRSSRISNALKSQNRPRAWFADPVGLTERLENRAAPPLENHSLGLWGRTGHAPRTLFVCFQSKKKLGSLLLGTHSFLFPSPSLSSNPHHATLRASK